MMNLRSRAAETFAALAALLLAAEGAMVSAQEPYVSDPDPDRPTLHVQPPLVPPNVPLSGRRAPASVINGITFIDVAVAAGLDFSGADLGNEPAITANPSNPSQIVLTSFSGSNWFSGGNASLFYSSDAGASWTFPFSVPPPPGTTSDFNCPCDQTMDWGRNGILYGTFLHVGGGVQTVFSAQSTNPADPSAWVYRAPGGVAQATNLPAFVTVDQPWIHSGPLPGDNGQTHVAVAYDNFDAGFVNSQIRAADSPGASPLDFTREPAANSDFQQPNDGMNPGTRIAVGPDGKIFVVYQRYVGGASTIKQLTYLINVSIDGGQTWS